MAVAFWGSKSTQRVVFDPYVPGETARVRDSIRRKLTQAAANDAGTATPTFTTRGASGAACTTHR